MRLGTIVYHLVRLAIAGWFLYAGWVKLADPDTFATVIDGYGLVSWSVAKALAHTLPAAEMLAGLGLLFDIRGSLAVVTVMLVVFTGVLAYGMSIGLAGDCGCLGPDDPAANTVHNLSDSLWRDVVGLLGCAWVYFWRYRTDPPVGPRNYFTRKDNS